MPVEDGTMPRPKREEFILDVRRMSTMRQPASVIADSALVDTHSIAGGLSRADLWLTPKVVESYNPADFASWPQEQQEQLRFAVEDFRKIAAQVAPDQPATSQQFKDGSDRFRELIKVLGTMIRTEWLRSLDALESQIEDWSHKANWRTRRVKKPLKESLLGSYEAEQLLIFAEPNLFVLDPIARFVPAAQGAVDFAFQPSYDAKTVSRDYNDTWYVYSEPREGVAKARRVRWNKQSFYDCLRQLSALA